MDKFVDYFKERQVIYHGTTERFLDKSINLYGRLQNREPLYLTDGINTGVGIAKQRAEAYKSQPTILAINSKLVFPRFIFDGTEPRIDFLNQEEYVSLTFGDDMSRVASDIAKLFEEKFGFFSF